VTDAFGKRLGERLRVENAPAIITRALRTADVAVTEIRYDNSPSVMRHPIQQEDAFLVSLQLRNVPNRQYWEDGRRTPMCNLRAGQTCLYDLKRSAAVLLDKPFHSLIFYLPRAALDAIADEAGAPPIRDLNYKLGVGVNDLTISRLGCLLLPALSRPNQATRLFLDHVLMAFGAHIAQSYGGMRPVSRPARGVLAPWQERRAKDFLRANLQGTSLKEVARECGLSVAHFSRAFRRTMGVAPHSWLIEQRILLSKERLRDDRLSLTDIAAECGFCDQSHFTHHFTRVVRMSPGAWRRALKE
jgi:AraC family transcriptional regulator